MMKNHKRNEVRSSFRSVLGVIGLCVVLTAPTVSLAMFEHGEMQRKHEEELRKVDKSLEEYVGLQRRFSELQHKNLTDSELQRIEILNNYEKLYAEGKPKDFGDFYDDLYKVHRRELDVHPQDQKRIRQLQDICSKKSNTGFRNCLFRLFEEGNISQEELVLVGEYGFVQSFEDDIRQFYDFTPGGPRSTTDICTVDPFKRIDIERQFGSLANFDAQYSQYPQYTDNLPIRYPWKEVPPHSLDWLEVYEASDSLTELFKQYPSRVVPGLAGGIFNPDWCLGMGECQGDAASAHGSSWHPWPKDNIERGQLVKYFFRWIYGDGLFSDTGWTDFAEYLYMDWSEYKWLDGSYRAEFELTDEELVGDNVYTSGLYGNKVYLALIFNTSPTRSFESSDIYAGETGFCDPADPDQFSQMANSDGTVTCGGVHGSPDTMFVLSDGTGVMPGLKCDSFGSRGECYIAETICKSTGHVGHDDMPHKPAGFDLHYYLETQNFEVYEYANVLNGTDDSDDDKHHRKGSEPRIGEAWTSSPADISSRPGVVSLSGEVQCRTKDEWQEIERSSAQCQEGLTDRTSGITPEFPEYEDYEEPKGGGTHFTLFVHGRSAGRTHCSSDHDHPSKIRISGGTDQATREWTPADDKEGSNSDWDYWNRFDFERPHEYDGEGSLGEVRYIGFNTEAFRGAYSTRSCGAQVQMANAIKVFCRGNNTCDIFTHSTGSLVVSRFFHDIHDEVSNYNIRKIHFLASAAGGSELATASYSASWAGNLGTPNKGLDWSVRTSQARSWDHNVTGGLEYETSSGEGHNIGLFFAGLSNAGNLFWKDLGMDAAQLLLRAVNDGVVSNHSLCNLNEVARVRTYCKLGNDRMWWWSRGFGKGHRWDNYHTVGAFGADYNHITSIEDWKWVLEETNWRQANSGHNNLEDNSLYYSNIFDDYGND